MVLSRNPKRIAAVARELPSRVSSASFSIRSDTTGSTVALSGDWTSLAMGKEAAGLSAAVDASSASRLDLSGLGRLDTAGAYVILRAMPPEATASGIEARP